jgi:hypothetical protein
LNLFYQKNDKHPSLLQKAACERDFPLWSGKTEGAGGHFWHDAVLEANIITPAP